MASDSVKIWEGARATGCGWFRVFGVGLAWADQRMHPPLDNVVRIGEHAFRYKTRITFEDRWQFTWTTRRNP